MEEAMQNNGDQERKFNSFLDLAMIEHFLISSSTEFKGEFMNFGIFLDKLGALDRQEEEEGLDKQKKFDRDFLKPLALIDMPEKQDEVGNARQGKKDFKGTVTIFDWMHVMGLGENIQVGFELSPILPSGEVRPSWKMFLQNGEGKKDYDKDKLMNIPLSEKGSAYFEIQYFEEEDEVRLAFTYLQKENDI